MQARRLAKRCSLGSRRRSAGPPPPAAPKPDSGRREGAGSAAALEEEDEDDDAVLEVDEEDEEEEGGAESPPPALPVRARGPAAKVRAAPPPRGGPHPGQWQEVAAVGGAHTNTRVATPIGSRRRGIGSVRRPRPPLPPLPLNKSSLQPPAAPCCASRALGGAVVSSAGPQRPGALGCRRGKTTRLSPAPSRPCGAGLPPGHWQGFATWPSRPGLGPTSWASPVPYLGQGESNKGLFLTPLFEDEWI